MNLKPVPLRLRRYGFDLVQIRREGDVAVYEQTKPGTKIRVYQVVRIRTKRADLYTGPEFSHAEHYPSPEEWGSLAWTARDRESAFLLADRLLSKTAVLDVGKEPGGVLTAKPIVQLTRTVTVS